MSKIPKRGSKVPGYKGGRITIHNISGVRNAIYVSNICDLPSLHEVIFERETNITS